VVNTADVRRARRRIAVRGFMFRSGDATSSTL
jgi:hypothetical protein